MRLRRGQRAALSLAVLLSVSAFAPPARAGSDDALVLVTGDLPARIAAVGRLAGDPSPQATEALLVAATDPAAEVRRLAIAALGDRDVDARLAFAPALALADDPLSGVTAVAAAARKRTPERLAVVVDAIGNPAAQVRLTAAEELRRWSVSEWPGCAELAGVWRDAAAQTDGENDPDLGLDVEALAGLVVDTMRSASACGLDEDEVARAQDQAEAFRIYQVAPELGVLRRGYWIRIRDARRAMTDLERAASDDQRTACLQPLAINYGNFFALADAAEEMLVAAFPGGALDPSMEHQLSQRLALLDTYLDDAEKCFANPVHFRPTGGGGGGGTVDPGASPLWFSFAFDAIYDDHFLGVREDVANLRVTDQMAERVVARAQWQSDPYDLRLPYPVFEDDFLRLRGEVAGEIYNGESQLSGATGWLDLWHQSRLAPDLVLWTSAEAEFERGWLDRSWPEHLQAPVLHGGFLTGLSGGEERDRPPSWALALGASAQTYFAPEGVASLRQDAGDSPGSAARPLWLPADLDEALRVTLDAKGRLEVYAEWDWGLYVEAFNRTHFHPNGVPTLLADGTQGARDGVIDVVTAEMAAWVGEWNEFMILVQLGAGIALFPDPTPKTYATPTGRVFLEAWEDDRTQDGFSFWIDAVRRVDDAPGNGDMMVHTSAELGAAVWEDDWDGHFEYHLSLFVDGAERATLVDEDPDQTATIDFGVQTTFWIHFEGTPHLGLTYQISALHDGPRQLAYVESLGEEDSRFLIRNVVMLTLGGAFGGRNIDFDDARAREWGLPQMRDPILPGGWLGGR